MRGRSALGFTLIELLIVVAVIGILAALAAPFLLQAKAAGNEASAIGSLRAINSAQSAYSATCARGAYSADIDFLVANAYLSPDMGFSPRSGYHLDLRAADGAVEGPLDCFGEQTWVTYYASGEPVSVNTGRRGFATSQAATIWQDLSGAAPVEPFVTAGTVSPIE